MKVRISRDALLIFLVLLACYAYFLPRWADWNQNSRFDLVRAIVEKGTLAIDDFAWNTGDYATVDGHIYSDKAPGLAFAAVPIHFAANAILHLRFVDSVVQRLAAGPAFGDTLKEGSTGLQIDKVRHALGILASTFLMVMLPSALLGVLIYSFLGDLNLPRTSRVATPLIYGLATSAFPYSGEFYAHQFAAVFLFAAFYLAFSMRRGRLGPRAMLPIGFLISYSVISEYPTALIGVAISLYAVAAVPNKRWIAGAIFAGLFPITLWAWHNLVIFGTPIKLGYEYSTLWQSEHSIGFLSLSAPTLESIWGITFDSYRGLYFTSPILLMTWPGLYLFWRTRMHRAELVVCGWATTSFMLFNASSAMWQGGFSIGPRYLVPMLPFAAVLLAYGIGGAHRRGWSAVMAALTAWSLAAIWVETIAGQAFPDYTTNPLFNYSLPKLLAGDVARNLGMIAGLRNGASLAPLAVLVGFLLWQLARERTSQAALPQTPTVAVHESR